MRLFALGFLASAFGYLSLVTRVLNWNRSFAIYALLGLSGGICLWFAAGALAPSRPRADATPPVSNTPTPSNAPRTPVRLPPIAVEYQVTAGLPIGVPPNTTLYVLGLYPDPTFPGLFQFSNSGTRLDFWPEKKLKSEEATVSFTRCAVTNLGASAVINLHLDFKAEYKKEVPDKEDPKQTHVGAVVATWIHRAIVGLLSPNNPFTFYIINQSPFFVGLTPPKIGVMQDPK
jgi:hypothetical protein